MQGVLLKQRYNVIEKIGEDDLSEDHLDIDTHDHTIKKFANNIIPELKLI